MGGGQRLCLVRRFQGWAAALRRRLDSRPSEATPVLTSGQSGRAPRPFQAWRSVASSRTPRLGETLVQGPPASPSTESPLDAAAGSLDWLVGVGDGVLGVGQEQGGL